MSAEKFDPKEIAAQIRRVLRENANPVDGMVQGQQQRTPNDTVISGTDHPETRLSFPPQEAQERLRDERQEQLLRAELDVAAPFHDLCTIILQRDVPFHEITKSNRSRDDVLREIDKSVGLASPIGKAMQDADDVLRTIDRMLRHKEPLDDKDAVDTVIEDARQKTTLLEMHMRLRQGDSPEPPAEGRAETGIEPERNNERMETLRQRLNIPHPITGQPLFRSQEFADYLFHNELRPRGVENQYDIAWEYARAVAVGESQPDLTKIIREARLKNPPHPLSGEEYRAYIDRAAQLVRGNFENEFAPDGTIRLSNNDILPFRQTFAEDGSRSITFEVPVVMIPDKSKIPEGQREERSLTLYYENMSLAGAAQLLIDEIRPVGDDGKPLTYTPSYTPIRMPARTMRGKGGEYFDRRRNKRGDRETRTRLRLTREATERARRDLNKDARTALDEMQHINAITTDEVNRYLMIHDTLQIDGTLSRADREFVAAIESRIEAHKGQKVLSELRVAGLAQISPEDADLLAQAHENGFELGSDQIDHYLQYLGTSGFKKFFTVPKSSPMYEDYEVVRTYLESARDTQKFEATLAEKVGDDLSQLLRSQINRRFSASEYQLFLRHYARSLLERRTFRGTKREIEAERRAFEKVNSVLLEFVGQERMTSQEKAALGNAVMSGDITGEEVDSYTRYRGGNQIITPGFRLGRKAREERVGEQMINRDSYEREAREIVAAINTYWSGSDIAALEAATRKYVSFAYRSEKPNGNAFADKQLTRDERRLMISARADYENIQRRGKR